MTALAMLNHSFPKVLQIQSFTIRFMRPIYPGYDLNSELKMEENQGFEMAVWRGD